MAEDKPKADIATDEQFYSHNVEEAVMRIVGGTLGDDNKKRKVAYDPFNMYMNSPGWDLLDPIQQEFYPPQTSLPRGKKHKLDTNLDPALRHMYHQHPTPHHQHDQQQHHSHNHPHNHHTSQPATTIPPTNAVPGSRAAVMRRPISPSTVPATWTESEATGSFTPKEQKAIDDYLSQFCVQHNLTRQQLCDRVWSSDRKKDSFWDAVTAVLPHRTRASVYKHVRRTYHVFEVRGKWTPEADIQLKQLVEERGSKWKVIGREMDRMPEDCRDRWRNYVKCGEKRKENKWSSEEQTKLQQAVAIEAAMAPDTPINWTAVSDRMGGTRSRIQCRYKWGKLKQARGT